MKREVTTQEALTELAAAKMKLESMQQLLVLREQLLSSKDDQINFQIFTIKEKDEEIKKLQEEGKEKDLKILGLEERLQTQLAYRFGSHSEKSFEQFSLFDDHDEDFPEEKVCGCGAKLVKIGERYTEKLNIIPEKIYVEKHHSTGNCDTWSFELHLHK